jgi:hypothetical protein
MNTIRVILTSLLFIISIGLHAQTESNAKSEFSGSLSFESGVDLETFLIGANVGLNYKSPRKFTFGIGLGYATSSISDEIPSEFNPGLFEDYPSDELKTIRILCGNSLNLNRRGTIRFHLQYGVGFIELTEVKNFRQISRGAFTFGFGSGFAWDTQITNSLSFELAPKFQFFVGRDFSLFILGRGQFIADRKPIYSFGLGMDVGRFLFDD